MIFVDASALCAILLDEPEARAFAEVIEHADGPATSAIAIYETALAVARTSNGDVGGALKRVQTLLRASNIDVIQIGEREGVVAVDAHGRFGKGRHPARLNMGDCFAYACACTNNAPLLFKGDDFTLTDVQVA